MQRIFLSSVSGLRSLLNEPINLVRPAMIGFDRRPVAPYHVAPVSTNLTVISESRLLWRARRFVKIYTRTGDQGQSSLFTGERRSKTDLVFHALGTVDELSSIIGLALAHLESVTPSIGDSSKKAAVCSQLELIQQRLFLLGSAVATPLAIDPDSSAPTSRPPRYARVNFPTEFVQSELEVWIDEMTNELPTLRQFILPSGGVLGSTLHLARAVCRRAERCVLAASYTAPTEPQTTSLVVEPAVICYLNRLSDYLFTVARYVTLLSGIPEKCVPIT